MKPNNQWEPVAVNAVNSTILIPHWGITLRRLFGAAVSGWPHPSAGEARDFHVMHKGVEVATLHVRQHDDI